MTNGQFQIPGRLGAVLIALAALTIYANTFDHEFTWDDGYNVVQNESIRDAANIPSFWVEAWGSTASDAMSQEINTNYWRPVTLSL